jgi:hypothetical protein
MQTDVAVDGQSSSVNSIKDGIADNFRAADAKVEVHSTEYFNNTYSPDLVLTWPGTKEKRLVYLRANSNPQYLQEDIVLLGDEDHSILMPLAASAVAAQETTVELELQALSSKHKVLVANSDSLQALAPGLKKSPYVGLISRAVLQGGKGVIRKPRAETITETVTDAFTSASHSSPEHIEEAVQAAALALDTPRSNAINSFMQALWIASGEPASTFPVTVASLPSIDSSSLSFLLEMDDLDDDEFWSRLGADIEIESILASGVVGSPANLQRLMKANASRLRARVCRVVEAASGVMENSWFLGAGGLGLNIADFSAIFTNSRIADLKMEGVDSRQTVDSVSERANGADIRILALSMAAKESRIDYAGLGEANISKDAQLSNVATALGSAAEVVSVTTAVGAASRRLICDLPSSTGRGAANSKYYLSEMALNAVPLFIPLEDTDLAALKAVVGYEEPKDTPDVPVSVNADEVGEIPTAE